jgi:hypothetical protein
LLQSFFFCITFLFFGVFLTALLALLLLLPFFFGSQLSWTNLPLFDLESEGSQGIGEERGVGFVSGLPLVRSAEDPVNLKRKVEFGGGEGEWFHI